MREPKLYRRRFIPNEIVHLKDDVIECINDRIIVTSWKVLRPRNDFSRGRSCYFLDDNFKVSRFFNKDDKLIYTYCDIIATEYNEATDEYIFHDLLVDVVIYEDGFVRVLDLGEIPEALDSGLFTVDHAKCALSATDRLLGIIYSGRLSELTKFLEPEAQ